jgi:hypothetical protein
MSAGFGSLPLTITIFDHRGTAALSRRTDVSPSLTGPFRTFHCSIFRRFCRGIQKMPWHERACPCRFSRACTVNTVMHGQHGHARSAHGPVQCSGGTTVISIFSVGSMIVFEPKTCMYENQMRISVNRLVLTQAV